MDYGSHASIEIPSDLTPKDEVDRLRKMANYPSAVVKEIRPKSINATDRDTNRPDEQDEYSSDENCLVIDEKTKKDNNTKKNAKRVRSPSPRSNFIGFKKRTIAKSLLLSKRTNEIKKLVVNTNAAEKPEENHAPQPQQQQPQPQQQPGELNRSEFERNLNELIRSKNLKVTTTVIPDLNHLNNISNNKLCDSLTDRPSGKRQPSQNITEYAQYLGLQPAVKFKCVKCSVSSFLSLSALNNHQRGCLMQPQPMPVITPSTSMLPPPSSTTTNFRVTRKVFLCASCGTYYENCDLFLHMREVHRKYICLFCLGMFSESTLLMQHITTKHNCAPKRYASAEEFVNGYTESCCLVCVNCEEIFPEKNLVMNHQCKGNKVTNNKETTDAKSDRLEKTLTPPQVDKPATITKSPTTSSNNNTTEVLLEEPPPPPPTDQPSTSTKPEDTNHDYLDLSISSKCDETDLNSSTVDETPPEINQHESDDNNTTAIPETPETTTTDELPADLTTQPNETITSEYLTPIVNSAPSSPDQEIIDPVTVSDPDFSPLNHQNGDTDQPQIEPLDLHLEKTTEPLDFIKDKKPLNLDLEKDLPESTYEEEEQQEQPDFIDRPMRNLVLVRQLDRNQMEELFNKTDREYKESLKREFEEETRRVPKVTLRIPPRTMAFSDPEYSDRVDDFNDYDTKTDRLEEEPHLNGVAKETPDYPVASDNVAIVELELDLPLDKFDIGDLIKVCLRATIPICLYCNHAKSIAVNAKQLALHAISQHRFSGTVNSITAEELIPDNFNTRILDSLDDLENVFFSLSDQPDYTAENGTVPKLVYECFQCRFATTVHKDLYSHNRKYHPKAILLCIMCKQNFYSYSEFICHLCPGNYILNYECKFRCCLCPCSELPSAFRLLVHLRKRHHACDVCLELCSNQSKLSNHVWKHKLHHYCYRCSIIYRNKPDITKHLFWKHGTESVLCKKCLQKKWPHVYHFCTPPVTFVCEECNMSFSKAVFLKVHKRLHTDEKPHECPEEKCTERFISKKLLNKHNWLRHSSQRNAEITKPPIVPDQPDTIHDLDKSSVLISPISESDVLKEKPSEEPPLATKSEPEEPLVKRKDVYDLPELNLSESDSDSDDATLEVKPKDDSLPKIEPIVETQDEKVLVVDGIWENFQNYQASIEKSKEQSVDEEEKKDNDEEECYANMNVVRVDHDYCAPYELLEKSTMDHDYCSFPPNPPPTPPTPKKEVVEDEKKPVKAVKKKSSSSSDSSDSDSSTCTCGSNCSCSSSSGSSSSSSTSDSDSSSEESKRRIQARRERRKERAKRKKEETVEVVEASARDTPPLELPILESDLDTDETETDEDFYDEHPQREANKIIAKKKNEIAELALEPPMVNGVVIECIRLSTPVPEVPVVKKKVKTKKKKKKSRSPPKQYVLHNIPANDNHNNKLSVQSVNVSRYPTFIPTPMITSPQVFRPKLLSQANTTAESGSETDSCVRASKRKRVPNKFYGYSSEEDFADKQHPPQQIPTFKWRKTELPSQKHQLHRHVVSATAHAHLTSSQQPQLYVPPLTIKNIPIPSTTTVLLPKKSPLTHTAPRRVPETLEARRYRKKSNSSYNDDTDSDTGRLHISNQPPPPVYYPPAPPAQPERNTENLYCYCQCPYDEVSEMIACDGKDCNIEWFHFECVGIMVPPKGKWFCPECRKKHSGKSDTNS